MLDLKLTMTEEVKKFPYKEGEHFNELYQEPCPACETPWVDSEDEEGFYCTNYDQWGREYEALCSICGYFAYIEMKAVVIKQSWKKKP